MMFDAFLRRQILHGLTPGHDLYFPYGRFAFLRSMIAWHREALKCERFQMSAVRGPEALRPERDLRCQFTVILQSYKRPCNMESMVRMFLQFDCVKNIIVSNNNPAPRSAISDLRSPITDPRLTIINQPHRYPASMFAVLALKEAEKGAQYFLSIDDDLLLFPAQIETLMLSLVADPSVPHGLVGQRMADKGTSLEQHITGNESVDILNRAYAFTADHIRRYAEILDRLGYMTDEEKAQLPFGSDIVLSKCGKGKPQIHDVGTLLSCPTAAKPGIARFKDEGFEAFRKGLWEKVNLLPGS